MPFSQTGVVRDLAALEAQLGERTAQRGSHIECVTLACALHPFQTTRRRRDKPVYVLALRLAVERHHHGAERPDVAHPARLAEKSGEVVVGEDEDRMLRRMARQDERIRTRL